MRRDYALMAMHLWLCTHGYALVVYCSRFGGTKKAYEEIVQAGYLAEVNCDEPRHPDGSIDVDGGGGQKRWCIAKVVKPWDAALQAIMSKTIKTAVASQSFNLDDGGNPVTLLAFNPLSFTLECYQRAIKAVEYSGVKLLFNAVLVLCITFESGGAGGQAVSEASGKLPTSESTAGALSDLLRMVSLWAEMDLGTPDQAKAYWVTMGHIGQVPSEVNVYAKAAREAGKAGTICEVIYEVRLVMGL